jgi:hypothetical protein
MPDYSASARLPFGSAARDYFMSNRDVMDAYRRDNLGLNPDDFAKLHWKLYGQQEGRYFRGRSAPKSITQNPYFRAGTPTSEALKYLYGEASSSAPAPSPEQTAATAEAARQKADRLLAARQVAARRSEADTYTQGYFDRNPDVWLAYQNYKPATAEQVMTRDEFARYHYNRYGQQEGRVWGPAAGASSGDMSGGGGGDGPSAGVGPGAGDKRGGLIKKLALGGLGSLSGYAGGGGTLGDYSDGGRLLRGPGDGVSDSIPATIAGKQPARLADGEFVIPARIVSELGNGSTQAGARQLYAMMDRVQARRRKTVGKDQVAVDSKASKLLPV